MDQTVPAKVEFGTSIKMRRLDYVTVEVYGSDSGTRRVYRLALLAGDFDRAAASGILSISPVGYQEVQLQVPHIADAILALRRCERVLVEDSGLPLATAQSIKSFPEPDGVIGKGGLVPPPMTNHPDPDDISVGRAIVDSQGSPHDCQVIHRAKSDILNADVCRRIMTRTFVPATDAQGKAIAAPFFLESRWPARH